MLKRLKLEALADVDILSSLHDMRLHILASQRQGWSF
jgi:hypothetical protein